MDPTFGLIDHVTATLALPLTLAANCWVWEAVSVTLVGLTVTDTVADRLTVAEADFAGSATLVAVTVTTWAEAMVPGALYRPVPEIDPTFGFRDQLTAVLGVPVTAAVNCWVWEAISVTLVGFTVTEIVGERLTVAEADLVGSATLVAVTFTAWAEAIVAGAV